MDGLVVDNGADRLSFGRTIGDQALQAYFIDSHPDNTSSASAASQFLRNLSDFLFSHRRCTRLLAVARVIAPGFPRGCNLTPCVAADMGVFSEAACENPV